MRLCTRRTGPSTDLSSGDQIVGRLAVRRPPRAHSGRARQRQLVRASDTASATPGSRAMAGDAVADLIFRSLSGQATQRLQDKHLQHQHRVLRWLLSLAAIRRRHRRLALSLEQREVDHIRQRHERNAGPGQLRPPPADVKEPEWLPRPPPPCHICQRIASF